MTNDDINNQISATVAHLEEIINLHLQREYPDTIDSSTVQQLAENIFNELSRDPYLPRRYINMDTMKDLRKSVVGICVTALRIQNYLGGGLRGEASELIFALLAVCCIIIGVCMLEPHHLNPTEIGIAWGLIGAGLNVFVTMMTGRALDSINPHFDIDCADDCAMVFIKKCQTITTQAPEKTNSDGLFKKNPTNNDVSKQQYIDMLDQFKNLLPEKDQEIFKKAIKAIENESYKNIRSKKELNNVELDVGSGYTNK